MGISELNQPLTDNERQRKKNQNENRKNKKTNCIGSIELKSNLNAINCYSIYRYSINIYICLYINMCIPFWNAHTQSIKKGK